MGNDKPDLKKAMERVELLTGKFKKPKSDWDYAVQLHTKWIVFLDYCRECKLLSKKQLDDLEVKLIPLKEYTLWNAPDLIDNEPKRKELLRILSRRKEAQDGK